MNDAFEKLERALAEPPDARCIADEEYDAPIAEVDWPPKADAIKEAVREALWAAVNLAFDSSEPEEAMAEIDRLLGKETP